MLNITRYVVRNLSVTKNLFASTATLTSEKTIQSIENKKVEKFRKPKNPAVAAVFQSLAEENETGSTSEPTTSQESSDIAKIITNAKTVNGLLTIAETKSDLSRSNALKIVQVLAEWSSIDKIKISEFENDARFVKLCKILGRSVKSHSQSDKNKASKIEKFKNEDLNVVLAVAGDDEAARMVSKLSMQQMIKVMKTLAKKKSRSVPLLRSLSFNISNQKEQCNIKQCGDVLFSMATLSMYDTAVISKICIDVLDALKTAITKSSAIGSVVTSLAMLRYRDTIVLDALTDWFVKNQEIARVQDLKAIIMSLAVLNYVPENHRNDLTEKIAKSLTIQDFQSSVEFLNYCWSLMANGFYHESYFDSVLNSAFLEKLKSESYGNEFSASSKMKLLNIDGGVKNFLPNYKGSMLDREKFKDIFDVLLIHNKEKQMIVNSMCDALSSLVPKHCLKLNRNTNMGFVIDAEFFVDKNGKPCEKEDSNGKKIAMIIQDFRDMCQGTQLCPSGITALNIKLLERTGYHVIGVPFYEFSNSDKLLKRVQYLEGKIKSLNN